MRMQLTTLRAATDAQVRHKMMNEEIQLREKIRNSEGIKCINRMNYHNDCISILSGNYCEGIGVGPR